MVQSSVDSQQTYHIDDVLDEFSIYGRYHLQVMFLAFLAFSVNTIHSTNYVFAAEAVQYRCKDFHDNASHCAAWSNATVCTEWEYDNTNSLVAEFGLACQEWKRTLVGTAHSAGYMVGLLIFGPLSDRLGRKIAVILTGVFAAVCGVVKSFSTSYWFYIAMEFLESAIGDTSSPIYVLEMEATSAKNKIQFNMYCCLGYTCGGFLLPLAAWWWPYWRTLLRVIYAPAFLFFFYQYLLDESPRWLLTRGKKLEAIRILQKAAKKNKMTLDTNILHNLTSESYKSVKYSDLLAKTFKSGALRLRFFVCITWWTTCTLIHYGMIINSVSLEGNKYVNFALTTGTKIPGIVLVRFILVRYKRKLPLMLSFLIGGSLCIMQPFVPKDIPWLSVFVYMLGKFVATMYLAITYIYTLELFPTYTRNSMHALCSSLGRLGSIAAPLTPLLLPIWSGFPTLIFGLSAVIAGLTTMLVTDISDDVLPDTVEEAENLGKSKMRMAQGDQTISLLNMKKDKKCHYLDTDVQL